MKTLLSALVLALLPAASFAGCMGEKEMSTSQCAQGQSWDATLQTCVPVVNS